MHACRSTLEDPTGAPALADPRGAKLQLESLEAGAVARLLADRRPAVRDRAIESLVAAGDTAVGPLTAFLKSSTSYESRAAAVFALYRIGTPQARAAVRAGLGDTDFRVRLAAARCAGMAKDLDALDRLMEMARKDHPAARRQAIAALGQLGDARAIPALLAAAANPEDRFVEHSVIYSLILLDQPDATKEALGSQAFKVRKAALIALDQMERSPLGRSDVETLIGAPDKDLRSAVLWVVAHHPDWAGVVVQHLGKRLRDPSLTASEKGGVSEALAAFSGNAELQQLLADVITAPDTRDSQILFLLDTLEASPIKEFPPAWMQALGALLSRPGANVRMRAVDVVRSRSLPGFDSQLEAIAADEKAPGQLRAGALDLLVTRNPKLTEGRLAFLLASAGSKSDAVLRQTAARVIGRSQPDHDQLLRIARKPVAQADALILSTMLECFRSSRDPDVGEALLAALRQSPATLRILGKDRLKALLTGYPDRVRQQAQPLFQQIDNDEKDRIERLQKLLPLLNAGGDTGRGRRLFFGDKVACASCHTIGAEGGHVGPDLTGIGAIRSGHDLLEAIVFPSISFVPGFEVYNVDMANDRVAGVVRSRSSDSVVLVTGPKGEVRIPRSKIRSMERSTVSLMPDGFDESLTRTELVDLLAFLQAEKTRPQTTAAAH